ncbi:MAG: hypothetical protein ACYTEQ_29705 [Planctomycetota bacterium]|jgi:hypothetical protein
MSQISFKISVPTDEGFLGRECNNPPCGKYFRVHGESIQPHMYCPYCGMRFPRDELHTSQQIRYLERAAGEKAKEYMYGEIDKMFGKFARQTRRNQFVSFEHKPIKYRAKRVSPMYHEQKVDSELVCPECSCRFEVYGIFGFCPCCRSENMLVYDANISIIRQEIERSDNAGRALRHAYSDLVSTFQTFSTTKAKRFTGDKPSFQELFPARKFFKETTGVDVLGSLDKTELLTIRRVFQKRHACLHAGGKVTESYVKKIPEDRDLLGQVVELSL